MFDPKALRGVYANSAALELWGATDLAELLARDFSVLSPAARARTDRLHETTTGGAVVDERWTFYPQGRPVTVDASISQVLVAGREVLLFEASPVDLEAEARRAVEALRHCAGPISLFDADGAALFASPAAYSAYAHDGDFHARFVDAEVGRDAWRSAVSGEPNAATVAVRTRAGDRWHHIDCRPVTDPVTGAVCVLLSETDVTDRVEAETARAAAEQKASMAEARHRFLTDMSHELRTPLNAVIGFSQVLAAASLDADQADQVARIRAAGDQLHLVLEQMLSQSQGEKGPTVMTQSDTPPTPAPAAAEPADERALRVLYVDDNDSNRLVMRALLAAQGVECVTADDGVEGVAAAEAQVWDVILMDIQMPRMDGVDCARRIRAEGPNATTPIIAVTANTLPEQVETYLAVGMNDWMAKPISAVELFTKLGRWCFQADDEDDFADSQAA